MLGCFNRKHPPIELGPDSLPAVSQSTINTKERREVKDSKERARGDDKKEKEAWGDSLPFIFLRPITPRSLFGVALSACDPNKEDWERVRSCSCNL